jgi:hypothetical protein
MRFKPKGGRGEERDVLYISGEERVTTEGASFAFVVGAEDDQNVFHRHHHGEGPDDDGQDADEILVRGFGREGGRIDVERAGANIAVDDADGLVG